MVRENAYRWAHFEPLCWWLFHCSLYGSAVHSNFHSCRNSTSCVFNFRLIYICYSTYLFRTHFNNVCTWWNPHACTSNRLRFSNRWKELWTSGITTLLEGRLRRIIAKNFLTNVKNVRNDENNTVFEEKSKNFLELMHFGPLPKLCSTFDVLFFLSLFSQKQYFFHRCKHFIRLSKNFLR